MRTLLVIISGIVPEGRFRAESIGASPVIIARKTARLFKFLGGSQLNANVL